MWTICKNNKDKIRKLAKKKRLSHVMMSSSNLVDDIILDMCREGIIDCLDKGFLDKRKHNSFIPFRLIITMAIAAKMRTHTSLTDIPVAIHDHRALAEIGYNLILDKNGLFTEGTIRHLLKKYTKEDLIDYYNTVVQNYIFPLKGIIPNIHILDCTKISVNIDNKNYENSSLARDRRGNLMRGYKLASLRGLYNDTGIIEEIRFDTASMHDLALSEEMVKTTDCLKWGDKLIIDRGFLSRELINYLKKEKGVDTYIPLRHSMTAFQEAVAVAIEKNKWASHPSKKRTNQKISFVPELVGWDSKNISEDVTLNACVVWDNDSDMYFVFVTTDTEASAKEIVLTYDIRTEIEEDYRQLKDFWKLEDFKTTKYNIIAFHIICVLFGYLFYQLYINGENGSQYLGKSLPIAMKGYKRKVFGHLVLYGGNYFCCMSMGEFLEFRDTCNQEIKEYLLEFLK